MSKWFEVTATKTSVVMVEVEDDQTQEDAFEFALGEVGEYDEAEISDEITDPESVDRSRRHADQVLSLE
jgi:hypothetical protein